MPARMTAQFIVICGIDGSGKTTQQRLLADALCSQERTVHQTQNPTQWYRKDPRVRTFLDSGVSPVSMEALALLAATDRLIQVETEIRPLLAVGTDVICDRYVYSTFAYFAVRGADMHFISAINGKIEPPNKSILLRVDPEEARRRVTQRDAGRAKYEERLPDFMRKVQDNLVKYFPDTGLIVDGMQSVDSVFEAILAYVNARV